MEKYFIGIDSGTTGVKAVLFDLNGKEICKKSYALQSIFPAEGQYEEDMLEIWEKTKLCVQAIVQGYPREDIVGIGITAQGDGAWLLDESGAPVRNGICFCDGRAAEFVDQWVEDGTCEKLFELTGTRVFTGNQNGIIRWLDRYEPESLQRAKYILHLKDYLYYRFTGEITTDASDQSLILLNQETRQYLEEAFALCGIAAYRDKYAPVLPAKENASKIQKNLAEELGLCASTLVTSGPMDVVACALGSGVVENGDCCSIIGTAALHEMALDKPLQDHIHAGMTVTHILENRWMRLMASLAGTPNLEWMLENFGQQITFQAKQKNVNVYAYMEEMIKNVPIGANGVMYHPYLLAGGERAPFTNARARANYSGLNVRNTLADMVRATYEGVAYAMLDCYQSMPQAVQSITLCGGGASSAFWCQMFADTLGSSLKTVQGQELGALGVVINNAVVQGYYTDYLQAVRQIVKVDKVYTPDMAKHEQYLSFYSLFRTVRKDMEPSWNLRNEIMRKA